MLLPYAIVLRIWFLFLSVCLDNIYTLLFTDDSKNSWGLELTRYTLRAIYFLNLYSSNRCKKVENGHKSIYLARDGPKIFKNGSEHHSRQVFVKSCSQGSDLLAREHFFGWTGKYTIRVNPM